MKKNHFLCYIDRQRCARVEKVLGYLTSSSFCLCSCPYLFMWHNSSIQANPKTQIWGWLPTIIIFKIQDDEIPEKIRGLPEPFRRELLLAGDSQVRTELKQTLNELGDPIKVSLKLSISKLNIKLRNHCQKLNFWMNMN
jgi:hypothetical protein